jgi:hypothetical protein
LPSARASYSVTGWALRVGSVHGKDLEAFLGQAESQVERQRRFVDAAFLTYDGQGLCWHANKHFMCLSNVGNA